MGPAILIVTTARLSYIGLLSISSQVRLGQKAVGKGFVMKRSYYHTYFIVFYMYIVVIISGCEVLDTPAGLGNSDNNIHSQAAALPGSFAELMDFRAIPHSKSWRTFQASGYDREGGFYDSGNFLRIEDNRHYVLMETKGPGCIDRMWFTYKSEIGKEPYDLLIYLDNPEKPAINVDLDELFLGKHPPFIAPLTNICGNKKYPARFSYVPVGFQRSCKVVLVPRAADDRYKYRFNSAGRKIPHIYYQITYRKFQPGTRIRQFMWDLDQNESKALTKIQSVWNKAGLSPWGALADLEENEATVEVEVNTSTILFDIAGPGVIYGLELSTEHPEDVWLDILWDGAANPDVHVPLGPFFACSSAGIPKRDVRGLWLGYANSQYYCYFPMPFQKRARIQIRSHAKKKVLVTAYLQHKKEFPAGTDGIFCARRYDHLSPPIGKNYTVLDIEGQGHFIGLVMDRPGHMEGDEFFFVDGENEPSIHGTGTEDFFNFAWGLGHTASLTLHGITIQDDSPICYRIHLPATVPFHDSLRITWEHGHDSQKGANLHKGRYSGIVFYYRVPPGR